MFKKTIDVAIVGSGPYGLSIAAHLQKRGVVFRIFGQPMQTWLTEMPCGMQLKSEGFASDLSDPDGYFTLKQYCKEQNLPYSDHGLPVPLDTFASYGLAFQRRLVPAVERKAVVMIERAGDGFMLRLDDGQTLEARRVVVATGLSAFRNMPRLLAHLPADLCSHSSEHRDLECFRGRDVTVVGGGASALDLAGLLHAGGAAVRLICRSSTVEIHQGPGLKERSLWQRIRHPRSGLGNSLRSYMVARAPLLFHRLPQAIRLRVVRTHLGPAGGWFIRDLVVGKVPMLLGCSITSAEASNDRVRLRIVAEDGTESYLTTDHVIAATGFRPDLRRLPFLHATLAGQLRHVNQVPTLSSSFESSVAGLFFVGAISANSFGPVVRFAYGASFTATRTSQRLDRCAWLSMLERLPEKTY